MSCIKFCIFKNAHGVQWVLTPETICSYTHTFPTVMVLTLELPSVYIVYTLPGWSLTFKQIKPPPLFP